jgi:NADH-quinone oxidoreductase subunit M
MLLSILYVYFVAGTTDFEALLSHEFSLTEQKFLWLAFFCIFRIKNSNASFTYLAT